MPDAEYQFVVGQQFWTLLEIEVGGEVKLNAAPFSPLHKRILPIRKLTGLGTLKRDPIALKLRTSVEAIQAAAAPIRVGVIGVRGKLQQDL